jgi:hypothetical protein
LCVKNVRMTACLHRPIEHGKASHLASLKDDLTVETTFEGL